MQTAWNEYHCLKFICDITMWFSTRINAKVCSLYLTGHSVQQRQGAISPALVPLLDLPRAPLPEIWYDLRQHAFLPPQGNKFFYPHTPGPHLLTHDYRPAGRQGGPHMRCSTGRRLRLHAMLMYTDAGSRAHSVRPERDGHAARRGETLWAAACSMLAADETPVWERGLGAEPMRRRRPHARVRVFARHLHALLYASVVHHPDTALHVLIEYGYSNGTDEDVSAVEGEEMFRMKWSVRCELDAYTSKPFDALPVDERLHVRMLVTTLYMKREKARPEEPLLSPRQLMLPLLLRPVATIASCKLYKMQDSGRAIWPLQLEVALVEGRSRPPSILPV
ncbi:hypothetical protein GGX14DRAFT_577658 [Mycena pura]|uniref:Uncharacterized protein n=1 Tax=Mycena pura TaxID=153505 RepID=A0AAD6UR24_9AGAR|nr:hypothetical protein GGX14DRAFT_577658 [Mycena pura]